MNTNKNEFEQIEGASVVLIERGVYRITDLYKFKDALFAKVRNGYIVLRANKITSAASIQWSQIIGIDHVVQFDGPKQVTAPKPEPKAKATRTKRKVAA